MKALHFDGKTLRLTHDAAVPRREGEALVQVLSAGICNTDLEILKGYAGFTGVPGHEFVGRVVESPDLSIVGRRVVGEINAGCGACELCKSGDSRHCPARTVLGIVGRDGAFAEFLSLPPRNLIEIPDSISNEHAVFVEPLAAACNILEQVDIRHNDRVAVVGDGKLAQLIVRVLSFTGCELTAIGKHQDKLDLLPGHATRSRLLIGSGASAEESVRLLTEELSRDRFDVVVEASGSPQGLCLALNIVRPRGTVVLKSTHHGLTSMDLSKVVVNEVKLIGSRCGRFRDALELLSSNRIDVSPLISARFSLDEGVEAIQTASERGMLKVLLQPNPIRRTA